MSKSKKISRLFSGYFKLGAMRAQRKCPHERRKTTCSFSRTTNVAQSSQALWIKPLLSTKRITIISTDWKLNYYLISQWPRSKRQRLLRVSKYLVERRPLQQSLNARLDVVSSELTIDHSTWLNLRSSNSNSSNQYF